MRVSEENGAARCRLESIQKAAITSPYRGADKSLARTGRKQAAPVKSVMGRGMD